MLRSTLNKILLTVLVFGVVLYQKFPLLDVPGTSVSIRLEDFVLGVVFISILPYYLSKLKVFSKQPLERSIILFLSLGLISVISAVLLTATVLPQLSLLHWVRRIEYFIPLFLVLSLPANYSSKYLDYIVKLLLISVIAVFIYGVGQKELNWPVIVTQSPESSKGIAMRYIPGAHLSSTFAGHYDLSSFMVLVLPVFAAILFSVKGKVNKAVFITALLAGLWLLANSLSRTSVISYFAGIGISLMLLRKYKELIVIGVISLLVFSFSSSLMDRYWQIIEVTLKSVGQTFTTQVYAQSSDVLPARVKDSFPTPTPVPVFEDRSTSIRLAIEWPRAIRALSKNPLLGTGYSSITLATDNDYLRALGEVGLLGTAAFLLILANIFSVIVKGLKHRSKFSKIEYGFIAGFTGALVGVLLNGIFIDVFEASKFAVTFWLMAGFVVYLVRSAKSDEKTI